MGVDMSFRTGAIVIATLAGLSGPAVAKTLPGVQLTPANQPARCTTAGRLTAFLQDRNPRLAAKFNNIAADYIRHGRDLGIRWDFAFFQMVVETNSLKYTGDVSPRQNNFAGLGATGGGVKGESFRTVSDGVRAHLQHLMLYAGVRVDDPVADRTRKVQSWRILDKWRNRIGRPITYGDVGSKWAPADRGYAADMQSIADAFYRSRCNRPDPRPELMAALGDRDARTPNRRNFNSTSRTALGASSVRSTAAATSNSTAGYRTLNAPRTNNDQSRTTRTAAAAKFANPGVKPTPRTASTKCRVWTASYGGQAATIIKSSTDSTVNYTVLDVNKGREDAETKAYIAAYAKGGRRIGDFANKSAAMDKAFKLCPKG